LGDIDEAQLYYQRVLAITQRYGPVGNMMVATSYAEHVRADYPRAVSLIFAGKSGSGDDSREKMLLEAIDLMDEALRFEAAWPRPWAAPHLYLVKGIAQYKLGQRDVATDSLEEGLARCQEPYPSLHTKSKESPTSRRELEVTLADYYVEAGRFDEAVAVFVDGIAVRIEQFGSADHLQVALAELRFGMFLLRHDRFDRAEDSLLTAHEKLSRNPSATSATVERAASQLTDLYAALQEPTEAVKWQAELDQIKASAEEH
jgi:tetratricopeptide (TPR) repeat protein